MEKLTTNIERKGRKTQDSSRKVRTKGEEKNSHSKNDGTKKRDVNVS